MNKISHLKKIRLKKNEFRTHLSPCEDHRLPQVFKHEGESRCSVRHSVRSVQNDKATVVIIEFLEIGEKIKNES
jgi:hypothetical protein